MRAACTAGLIDLSQEDMSKASYFISRGALRTGAGKGGMVSWRRKLFVAMAHNAADPAARFGLPLRRTVTMGSDVEV